MAGEGQLQELLKLTKEEDDLKSLTRELEKGKNTVEKKCEATNLFDEEVRAFFEENDAESRRRSERQHQRTEETTQRELEAGRLRKIKMEELKSAQQHEQKLEAAMCTLASREKEKGRQAHWRHLLVESSKQAKITRDQAVQEVKRADSEFKLANREKLAEYLKQKSEEKLKVEQCKKNLFDKYREAREFQRILEKEEQAQLERQQEKVEFFAEKKAAKLRRELMETQDKLTENLKSEETKLQKEKMERSLKIHNMRSALKQQAEKKHRQLKEKYQQAEATLNTTIKTDQIETEVAQEGIEETSFDLEQENLIARLFAAICVFIYGLLVRPCSNNEDTS